MNRIRHCPNPEGLVRLATGAAARDERESIEQHVAVCEDCRADLADMARLGPAETWSRTSGRPERMPDGLWNAVSKQLEPAGLRFRVTIDAVAGAARATAARGAEWLEQSARRGAGSVAWLTLIRGRAELRPVGWSPVRGGDDPPAGDDAAGRAGSRVVAATNDHEVLFRRGPDRLTVVLTHRGLPAGGRTLRLHGAAIETTTTTDSSGVAVFRKLPVGDYELELEGIET